MIGLIWTDTSFRLGHSVFKIREYDSVMPRKFISFFCLENESDGKGARNNESVENSPIFPQASKSETVLVAKIQ